MSILYTSSNFASDGSNRLKEKLVLIVLLLCAFLGTTLILFATPEGIGISNSDAVNYLKAAQSLVNGEGFRGYDGNAYVRWPPLFPTLIALPTFIGVPRIESLRLVNSLGAGLTVLASGLVLMKLLRSRILVILGTLAVLVAWPLFITAYFAFAETIFNLLVALFILALWPVLEKLSPRSLAVLILVTVLLTLERYLGVAFVICGVLAIMLLARGTSFRTRLIYAVSFGILASIPLGLWVLRNYLLVGSIAGGTWELQQHLIVQAPGVILSWLWPEASIQLTNDPTIAIAIVIGFTLALSALALFVQARTAASHLSLSALRQMAVIPVGLCLIVYLIVFIILAERLNVHVNDRILSPTFLLFIALILVIVDTLTYHLDKRFGSLIAAIPIILIALWLLRPTTRLLREVELIRRDFTALDFNQPTWQNSELIRWLNQNPQPGQLYSNATFSVALLTDAYVRIAPIDLERWERRKDEPDQILIWYRDVDALGCLHSSGSNLCFDTAYQIDELETLFTVKPLTEGNEGGIYQLLPR